MLPRQAWRTRRRRLRATRLPARPLPGTRPPTSLPPRPSARLPPRAARGPRAFSLPPDFLLQSPTGTTEITCAIHDDASVTVNPALSCAPVASPSDAPVRTSVSEYSAPGSTPCSATVSDGEAPPCRKAKTYPCPSCQGWKAAQDCPSSGSAAGVRLNTTPDRPARCCAYQPSHHDVSARSAAGIVVRSVQKVTWVSIASGIRNDAV